MERKGKKENNVFVRYGGLNLVQGKTKNFTKRSKSTSFHRPPTNFGIYAFPIKAIELFLCGHRLIMNDNGSLKNKVNNRKEFKYEGVIWHHLDEHVNGVILQREGSWVLTEFKVWEKALLKASLNMRYGERKDGWDFSTKSINETIRSGISGLYSKDHLEVFIPQKV